MNLFIKLLLALLPAVVVYWAHSPPRGARATMMFPVMLMIWLWWASRDTRPPVSMGFLSAAGVLCPAWAILVRLPWDRPHARRLRWVVLLPGLAQWVGFACFRRDSFSIGLAVGGAVTVFAVIAMDLLLRPCQGAVLQANHMGRESGETSTLRTQR